MHLSSNKQMLVIVEYLQLLLQQVLCLDMILKSLLLTPPECVFLCGLLQSRCNCSISMFVKSINQDFPTFSFQSLYDPLTKGPKDSVI